MPGAEGESKRDTTLLVTSINCLNPQISARHLFLLNVFSRERSWSLKIARFEIFLSFNKRKSWTRSVWENPHSRNCTKNARISFSCELASRSVSCFHFPSTFLSRSPPLGNLPNMFRVPFPSSVSARRSDYFLKRQLSLLKKLINFLSTCQRLKFQVPDVEVI